jgi:hypothetical protein
VFLTPALPSRWFRTSGFERALLQVKLVRVHSVNAPSHAELIRQLLWKEPSRPVVVSLGKRVQDRSGGHDPGISAQAIYLLLLKNPGRTF